MSQLRSEQESESERPTPKLARKPKAAAAKKPPAAAAASKAAAPAAKDAAPAAKRKPQLPKTAVPNLAAEDDDAEVSSPLVAPQVCLFFLGGRLCHQCLTLLADVCLGVCASQ